MKTLKYLMLLLAIAIALPAMAQKEEEKSMEKAIKVGDLKDLSVVKSTEGKLSNNNTFAVRMEGDTLVATVTSAKGTEHEIRMSNGVVERICRADSTAYCQKGFVPMKKDLNTTDVLQSFEFTNKPLEAARVEQYAK